MELKDGATYRLQNRADSSRSLNVYGISPTSLANVCLYTNNNNDICQQWVYHKVGNREYFTCKGLALAIFTGLSSVANVKNYNAHVDDFTETSYVTTKQISDSYIQIKLNYNGRYLTANQGSNGTSNGKDVNAAGNVYFYKGGLTDHSQDWKPILLDDDTTNPDTDTDKDPYTALNWSYVFNDPKNAWGYWGYSPTGNSNKNNGKPWIHWGIDIICNIGIPIYAPEAATVFQTGSGDNRGNYIVLKMDQLDPVSGRSMYVRFLHMKEQAKVTSGHISKGTLLGYVGNSGTKTPHLHLDINTKTSTQAGGGDYRSDNTINPVRFFPNISFPNNYYQEGV